MQLYLCYEEPDRDMQGVNFETYIALVDFEKAFDRINWNSLDSSN